MYASSTKRWVKACRVVIDEVYDRPQEVRRWALKQRFHEPDDLTGWRSTKGRYFAGIVRKLRRYFGPKLELLEHDGDDPNGVVYLAFSHGEQAEVPGIHWDSPESAYVALIYLTPNLPIACGTSFWQHKRTGLTRAPVRADERRMRATCEELHEEMERDAQSRSRWIEIDRIGYRYNRAVVFPAYALHSATLHLGSSPRDGRMYQLVMFRA